MHGRSILCDPNRIGHARLAAIFRWHGGTRLSRTTAYQQAESGRKAREEFCPSPPPTPLQRKPLRDSSTVKSDLETARLTRRAYASLRNQTWNEAYALKYFDNMGFGRGTHGGKWRIHCSDASGMPSCGVVKSGASCGLCVWWLWCHWFCQGLCWKIHRYSFGQQPCQSQQAA